MELVIIFAIFFFFSISCFETVASVELLRGESDESARSQLNSNIAHCASLLHLLVNNVLLGSMNQSDATTLTRSQIPSGEYVQKLKSVIEALALQSREKLQIEFQVHGEILEFPDELAVTQVLLNFCSNAVKYATSRIVVVLKMESCGWFEGRVLDDGPGVSKELQEHLFGGLFNAVFLESFKFQSFSKVCLGKMA